MKKQQNSFFREARRRCNWLATRPEKFPSLFDPKRLRRRRPARSKLQAYAKIMALHMKHMVLECQRVGVPKADGSVLGLSEAQIAMRTGLGDPRIRRKDHWKGRRLIAMRIRELREAGLLTPPKAWKIGKATNPRYLVEQGPKAGTWRLYPSVRRIALAFFKLIHLDRRLEAEIDDLRRRRAAGEVAPIVDVQLRRARDRAIKARQRERRRAEQQILLVPSRAVAAKRVTLRKRE